MPLYVVELTTPAWKTNTQFTRSDALIHPIHTIHTSLFVFKWTSELHILWSSDLALNM